MNRLLYFFLLALLCIYQSQVTFSSTSSKAVRVELFSIEDGLSQTAVSCLHLDSYGFIWVGTQDGLNRYDGYGFTSYRNHPLDSTTLANNYINTIREDKQGNLWIGTWSGLSYFDRRKERFKNYYHKPNDETSLSDNRIFSIYQDSYGIIWVKTVASLDRYDPNTDSFIRYPHYSDVFTYSSENNDFVVFEDRNSRLWVGTKEGLMIFDRQLGLFKRYSNIPNKENSLSNNRVKDVYEDKTGNIWVATSYGLNLYRPNSDDFKRLVHNPNDYSSLPNNIVNLIFEDTWGNLWVGTDAGLFKLNPSDLRFETYGLFAKGNELVTPTITSIVEDSSNILWIGTISGLIKWDRKAQKFKLFSKFNDGSNMFSGNSIASLYEDKQGLIWVGTWGTGLHILDKEQNKVIKYYEASSNRRIVNDYVHAIHETRGGEVLIGTRNGVQYFDGTKGVFIDFFNRYGIDASPVFNDNRVFDIAEERDGNLWFATRIGLHRFNGEKLTSFYFNPNNSNSISSNEVHTLAIDGDSLLWVGTFDGLNRIRLSDLRITRYKKESVFKKGNLISNDIISLSVCSRGKIWIGTSSGLHCYSHLTNDFALFTETEGIPNNLIYSILEDNRGNIWMSTNWGLAMLNPETKSIVSYGISDGLQSYEFNVGASFKSVKGELFFGGISGFNTFFPDSISMNTNIPRVIITSFDVIGPQGRISIPVHNQEYIEIDDSFSLINIEFAALDFTRPEKNQYRYKMEGLDSDWIDLGYKRSATFSWLREGTYVFKVKGSNSDGVWNEQGAVLKIVVKTVFWKTRTAQFLYIVLVVLSLVLFLRTRTRMLRKTSRLLRERELSMKEIELQKEELLLKNKSITDSINYAKRIQEALIPSEEQFLRILPDSFILYMPKDIVSGDFYWINETHNKIFVAAVDCTGHGVPGAFMSIIGVELLRNTTNIMGLNDAAEILNRLDRGVFETFTKGTEVSFMSVKDGMDVSFCVIDKENNTLQFAGAFSNLYLIRDSKIIELKGDRYTVGVGAEPDRPVFNSHFIQIEPDDMVYIFTDGYIDQFGGPEGKKYKFRRFRQLLLTIHQLPLDEQKEQLKRSISEWRGSHEQVDDILIIGIRTDLSCLF